MGENSGSVGSGSSAGSISSVSSVSLNSSQSVGGLLMILGELQKSQNSRVELNQIKNPAAKYEMPWLDKSAEAKAQRYAFGGKEYSIKRQNQQVLEFEMLTAYSHLFEGSVAPVKMDGRRHMISKQARDLELDIHSRSIDCAAFEILKSVDYSMREKLTRQSIKISIIKEDSDYLAAA